MLSVPVVATTVVGVFALLTSRSTVICGTSVILHTLPRSTLFQEKSTGSATVAPAIGELITASLVDD